jgi:hypothetical protein
MGSPVWSRDGMIAVANAHKEKVKVTFMHGAHLADPDKLFNAGLDGNAWRAIDFLEGDKVDAPALKNLAGLYHHQSVEIEEETPAKAPAGAAAKVRKQKDMKRWRFPLIVRLSVRRTSGIAIPR